MIAKKFCLSSEPAGRSQCLKFLATLTMLTLFASLPAAAANGREFADLDDYNNTPEIEGQAQAIITSDAGGTPMSALSASLSIPTGVAVDNAGNLYIVALGQNRVFKVDRAGQLTLVAGDGTSGFSGDGGLATEASLNTPRGVAVDSDGKLYIADTGNLRIRRVEPATGVIATVAGNGSRGFSGDDGAATAASLDFPSGVAVDSSGNLYIADTGNHRIRRVDSSGMINGVAGNGSASFSGDGGPATAASLAWPFAVAVGGSGNLYIADTGNHRIRRVDASGTITSVAGNGSAYFSGDGGRAIAASLAWPFAVAVDRGGNLYVADPYNQRIRRVDCGGMITTVAGTGSYGFNDDDELATFASLYRSSRVTVDENGNRYVADTDNHRSCRSDTSTGVITTVAGNGTYSFSGDGGLATSARLASPSGIAFDRSGQLYIADTANGRVRLVKLGPVAAIDSLADKIADSGLLPAIKTSIAARLSRAENLVSDNELNDDTAACGVVGSIVNEITANSRKLNAAEANTLRQSADIARRTLGCR